jgi:hypothetical protein
MLTALVRSVGAEWNARRLMRDVWRELLAIPKNRTQQKRTFLLGVLLDCLELLVPRLVVLRKGNDQATIGMLQDLRVGANMIELQQNRQALPDAVRLAVDNALLGTASHFAARAAARYQVMPSPDPLHNIDRALDAAVRWRVRAHGCCCAIWWASGSACLQRRRHIDLLPRTRGRQVRQSTARQHDQRLKHQRRARLALLACGLIAVIISTRPLTGCAWRSACRAG